MQRDDIVRQIGELHDYARHVYQLFIAWFTVFVSVNFATMGWLAKHEGSPAGNAWLTSLVAILFIVQNILGIIACSFVRACLSGMGEAIRCRETRLVDEDTSESDVGMQVSGTVPLALYKSVAGLIASALLFTTAAWGVLPFWPLQAIR